LQSGPGVVALAEQQPGLHPHAVAHPEGFGSRARDVLLDVLQVDVDRGMTAGAVPVLEHVGMAVDDHSGHLRQFSVAERVRHAAPSFSMWNLNSRSTSPLMVRNRA